MSDREEMQEWRKEIKLLQDDLDQLKENAPVTLLDEMEESVHSLQDCIDKVGEAIKTYDEIHAQEDE